MDKLYFFALSYIRWGFKMHMRRVKQILGPKHWKFAKKYSAILWKLNFSTVSKFVCVVIHDVLPSVLYLLAQLLTNRCPEFCEMFCVFRTQRVDRHSISNFYSVILLWILTLLNFGNLFVKVMNSLLEYLFGNCCTEFRKTL